MSTLASTDHAPEPVDGGAAPVAATGNVVVISADNTRLHVGPVDRILTHLEINQSNLAEVATRFPEWYDTTGRKLTVSATEGGVELMRAAAPPTIDEQLLLDRIRLALAHMQVAVHTHVFPAMRSYRVPVVYGELPDVLAALSATFALPATTVGGAVSKCHDASAHPH